MYTTNTNIRVRYVETDKMGVVYHGNYAQYFDMGRTESLREIGLSYLDIENKGIVMPVITISAKYYKSVYYDDVITVKTMLKNLPGYKIDFEYEIHNQRGELTTTGKTSLVFIDMKTKKPIRAPEFLLEKLRPFFE